MRHVVSLALLLAVAACHRSEPPEAAPEESAASGPAIALLDRMRAGAWRDRRWPTLSWADVPALMTRLDSQEHLGAFPVNPLSSQSQRTCTEGVMAMWLIEGIRRKRPSGYPSLNPLLSGGDHPGDLDWQFASELNAPVAATAYRAWWKKIDGKEAAAPDPLEGTGLSWY